MEVVKCEKGLEARGEEVLEGQERGLPVLFHLLWVLSNISSSLSVLITATFGLRSTTPSWTNLTSTISLGISFWPSSTSLTFSSLTGEEQSDKASAPILIF